MRETRRMQRAPRADRRTYYGILCRVAQELWDNPLIISGILSSPTPEIGAITVESYSYA